MEMLEISLTDHPGPRRIDEYAVIPGDIEFGRHCGQAMAGRKFCGAR
jgi:hypothetical protein